MQTELYNKLDKGSSLTDVQLYVKEVIKERGFADQSVQENMLMLIEETGELAKAIRKNTGGMSVDEERICKYDTVENEAADIFIVLLSICNKLNVNLYEAFMEKEKINIGRNWTINKEEKE